MKKMYFNVKNYLFSAEGYILDQICSFDQRCGLNQRFGLEAVGSIKGV